MTAEIPFSDDIDWTEYFEKTIKEIEAKFTSLSRTLTLNDDEDEGPNTDTNKSKV